MDLSVQMQNQILFAQAHKLFLAFSFSISIGRRRRLRLGFLLRRPAFSLRGRNPLPRFIAHRPLGARLCLSFGGLPGRSTPPTTGQQFPHFAELGDFFVESFED